MILTQIIEEVHDLILQVVGDFLILDKLFPVSRESVLVVRIRDGVFQIRQRIVHYLAEADDFLAGLDKGQLRSRDQTIVNVLDATVRIRFRIFLVFDDGCHDLFDEFGEPDHNESVDDVEYSMEHGNAIDHRRGFIYVHPGDNPLDKADKRMEDGQNPQDAENIENRVGQCGAPGVRIPDCSRDIGRDGGADILSQDHGSRHIKLQPSHVEKYKGKRDSRTG